MRIGDLWRRLRGGESLGTHELEANGVLRLPAEVGVTVRVEAGHVVITREGDEEDHVLEPGAVFVLEPRSNSNSVAWALQPSRVEVRTWSEHATVPAAPLFAR